MKTIAVDVYIGLMKSTVNSDQPLTVVVAQPFSSGFDHYYWSRATVEIPYQTSVTDIGKHAIHPVDARDGRTDA